MSKINKTEFLSFSEIPNPTMIRIENRELKEIIVELEKKLQEEIKENHKMVIEILELKQENKQQLEALTEWVNGERINDIKHISKDKIREKMKSIKEKRNKEIDEIGCSFLGSAIDVLEELLEE